MNEITPADIIAWQNEIRSKNYSESYQRMLQNQVTALLTHAQKIYDTVADDEDIFESDSEKPWDRMKHFRKEDVDGILQITLSNGVYVNKANFENYRYIYLGSDKDGFIKVPRGILENITEECEKAGIEYEIEDKQRKGHPIHVEFIGKLKESQIPAVEKLLQYDNGVLNAATAFGKTVVCCNVIAQRKVSTLILLQSSALME